AVIVFFVLSGFLISTILLNDKEKCSNGLLVVRNFLVRRMLRIFPAYFLLLFILMIIGYPFLEGELPYQFTFTSNYFFYNKTVVTHTSHTWSLAIEEQFYLVWPWLIIFISSFYQPFIFLGCTVISLFSSWYFGCADDYSCGLLMNFLTTTNLVAFAVGGMYANMIRSEKGRKNITMIVRFSFLAVTPLFLYWALTPLFSLEHRFEFLRVTAYSVLALCIIHVIMGIEKGAIKTRVIDNSFIGLTGRISYGIYLFHLPVQFYFTQYLIIWASQKGLSNSLYLWFFPFCLTVFGLAYLSYQLFERRVLKLKRHFSFTES
ncbi:MAG TPA: acyltransferase, partial [Chitinophagaceae bacterium]|nr:acyltransferase [Chitinophagaceae bacterium]